MIRSILNVDLGKGEINLGVKPESKLTQKIITSEPIQKIEVYQLYKSPLGHKGILKTTMEDAITRISAMKISPFSKQIKFISEGFNVLEDIPITLENLPFSELTDIPIGKDYVNYKGNVKLVRWRFLDSPEVPSKGFEDVNEQLDNFMQELDNIAKLPDKITKKESKVIESSNGLLSEQISDSEVGSALEVEEIPVKEFYNPVIRPEDVFGYLEAKLDVGDMLKPMAKVIESAYERLKPLYGVGLGYLGGYVDVNTIQPNIDVDFDVDQKLDLTDNILNVGFEFEKVMPRQLLDVPEKLDEFLDIGLTVAPYVNFDTLTVPNVDIPELTIPGTDILTTPKPKPKTPPPEIPPKTVPWLETPVITIPEFPLGGFDQIAGNITGSEMKAVKSPVKWIWDILF